MILNYIIERLDKDDDALETVFFSLFSIIILLPILIIDLITLIFKIVKEK